MLHGSDGGGSTAARAGGTFHVPDTSGANSGAQYGLSRYMSSFGEHQCARLTLQRMILIAVPKVRHGVQWKIEPSVPAALFGVNQLVPDEAELRRRRQPVERARHHGGAHFVSVEEDGDPLRMRERGPPAVTASQVQLLAVVAQQIELVRREVMLIARIEYDDLHRVDLHVRSHEVQVVPVTARLVVEPIETDYARR